MEGSLAGDPVTGITAGTTQGHCIAGDRLVFKAVCGQQFKRLGVLAGQSQVYIFHGQRFGDCDAVKAAEIDQLYQIFVPADAVEENVHAAGRVGGQGLLDWTHLVQKIAKDILVIFIAQVIIKSACHPGR